MGKTNAILKRELDGAELTIMVQPDGAGCTVKIFTEGLDWTDVPKSTAVKPATTGGAGGVEAEAERLLKDALKLIPGGL